MFNLNRKKEPALPTPPSEPRNPSMELRRALQSIMEDSPLRPHYPIQAPIIPKGVVPEGEKPQVAMDAMPEELSAAYFGFGNFEGFPGYPYLAQLALRSEYRNMASALATELTRKWIKFNSGDTDDESTKEKITAIEAEFKRFAVQQLIRKQAEHDALYGTGQILINIKGHNTSLPLKISNKTIAKDSLEGFKNVEPLWTTPLMYDSLNPASSSFYKPSSWWVMGVNWDATRLLIVTTREVPDMFKPAFNFSGISLSQLAEPYVNNWLRTRQSVSDLINNFSVLVLKTALEQSLISSSLAERVKFFLNLRSNKGLMVLDKEREELEQLAVPLGGLHELQSQAQEQMCAVSRIPATVLTGITPSGFGNTAEGEVRIWYDWIHAQQEAFYRAPIEIISKIVQLSLFGEIDESITFDFEPMFEMTEEQLSIIRTNDSVRAGNLIDRSVIDPQEERERLARDPDSGYNGIDIDREIAPPDEAEESAQLGRATA